MNKVIFCGYGKLGKDCLEKLISNGFEIAFILTHKELDRDSVDTFAEEKNISYTYKNSREYLFEMKNKIATLEPLFLISINYRYIIPKEIYTIPKHAINIHGSLLPKYRGRTPHVWSIINGEEVSGVTCHIMEENIDAGDIIEQSIVKIDEEDTGFTLLKKFEEIYPGLLIRSINKLFNKEKLMKQDERQASYFGKRSQEMGYIDFYKNAESVINFVRAQAYPYPGAYYHLGDGRKIVINKVCITDISLKGAPIGVIKYREGHYFVQCSDNTLKIEKYEIFS